MIACRSSFPPKSRGNSEIDTINDSPEPGVSASGFALPPKEPSRYSQRELVSNTHWFGRAITHHSITIRRASSSQSPDFADACQAHWRTAGRNYLAFRAKVGWVSRVGLR